MADDDQDQKTRTRSPAYPAIGLAEAIAKAEQLYAAEDKRFASLEAVAAHWNLPAKSSAFLVAIAALKQFGLLEEEGKKEDRRLRLTELGLDIVVHPVGSKERDEGIKTAALNPKIHRELWGKYQAKLPPDVSLRIYLIREREREGAGVVFNKNYVDGFISQFRSTLAFAKLATDDTIPPAGDNKPAWSSPHWGLGGAEMKGKSDPTPPVTPPTPPGHKMRDLPITLPSSLEVAIFRVPVPMSETDFKTLINSLTAMKDTLVVAEK